jgi:hypothetical protein
MRKITVLFILILAMITAGASGGAAARVDNVPYMPYASLDHGGSTVVPDPDMSFTTVLPEPGVPSLVDSLVDYGGQSSSPTNYSNARHVVHNHTLGWPAVAYEYGASRNNDVVFCKWNAFGFWEPPLTVSDQEVDAGRVHMSVDHDGNVHAVWHQTDDPGQTIYEVRYARYLNGATEWTDHQTLNNNPSISAHFPSMVIDYDNNAWVIWEEGDLQAPNEMYVNMSSDGGLNWDGQVIIPGGPYTQGWLLGTLDAGLDGTIHAQFMGDDDPGNPYYSYRDPDTGDWATGERCVQGMGGSLYTGTMVVDSKGVVHMAGVQNYGWGSNFGNIGTIKYWHGNYGDWSAVETPFLGQLQESWMDSFATFPTLAINPCDDLFMAWSQVDTVIEQTAVSGLYSSHKAHDAMEWEPMTLWTQKDEWDVVYPQLIHHVPYTDETTVPGLGSVWGAMVEAMQPASVFYMYHGDPLPCYSSAVAVSNFSSTEFNGDVHLSWNGSARGYNLYKSTDPAAHFTLLNCGVITGNAYVDSDVIPGVTYHYRITTVEEGREGDVQGTTSIRLSGTPAMKACSLQQNAPNPFNPVTKIGFSVPMTSHVSVKVYDSTGRLVKTLVDEKKSAGAHHVMWRGENNAGVSVPSGMYFYRMETKGFSETRRMLLVK